MTESLGEEVTRLRAENKLLVDDNVCLAAKVKQLTANNERLREVLTALFENRITVEKLENTMPNILLETPAESLDAIKAEGRIELLNEMLAMMKAKYIEDSDISTDELIEWVELAISLNTPTP